MHYHAHFFIRKEQLHIFNINVFYGKFIFFAMRQTKCYYNFLTLQKFKL
jgi:hypothetical protein